MRNIGTIQNSAELVSQAIGLVDKPDAQGACRSASPEIRFEHVKFHYGKGAGVIDDFSLVIRPGEKVGIVGRSGAGKSTLVNLLLRFYDLEGGRILIDGQDISTVKQESLRSTGRHGQPGHLAAAPLHPGQHPFRPPGCEPRSN